MFDEVVIGVAGKSQRVQTQCIHHGQPEQTHIRPCRSQMRGIESDQIVAQQKCQVSAEIVKLAQGLCEIALPKNEGLSGITSYGSEKMNLRVTEAYFEINGQTSEGK